NRDAERRPRGTGTRDRVTGSVTPPCYSVSAGLFTRRSPPLGRRAPPPTRDSVNPRSRNGTRALVHVGPAFTGGTIRGSHERCKGDPHRRRVGAPTDARFAHRPRMTRGLPEPEWPTCMGGRKP